MRLGTGPRGGFSATNTQLDGDSTPSGDVVDQGAARAPEPVVERDARSQRQEALGDANAQVVKGAGAVALQGEDALAGPEDRLDALSDRGEMKDALGLVPSRRPDDRCVELAGRFANSRPTQPLSPMANSPLPTHPLGALQQLDPDLSLVALGRSEGEGTRRPVAVQTGRAGESPRRSANATRTSRSRQHRRAPSGASSPPNGRTPRESSR